jgi:hypothetical protein
VRTPHRVAAILVACTVIASACTRSDSDVEESEEPAADEAAEQAGDGGDGDDGGGADDAGGSLLDQGGFGELENVCGPGEAGGPGGATETGLTPDEIRLGTITDKGSTDRSGLNEEMFDTAVAFAAWCNEHGGIQGREVVIDDLDAALFDYGQRIADACERDFALVGGGGVFDNQGIDQRIQCGLPNIPAFMVTAEAREAELQVQPIPNPNEQFQVALYRKFQELDPDATNFGVLWPDIGEGPAAVRAQLVEAVEQLGYDVVFDEQFRVIGETGWRGFVQRMRDANVEVFELIGEPESMVALQQAMVTEDWSPQFTSLQPNFFDNRYEAEGASSVSDATYIRTPFPTLDMADEVPAMGDFLELMERYNPDGKVALLGAQTMSAFLLFATAANRCGANLSRTCVIEEAAATTDWTAGGLHSPHQPGNTEATQCSVLVKVTSDGFQYDEELTQPNDGIYNCDPDDVVRLSGSATQPEG